MSIYHALKDSGARIENHYADLYTPVTAETTKILKSFGIEAITFKDTMENALWYELPMEFQPYWDSLQRNDLPEEGNVYLTKPLIDF